LPFVPNAAQKRQNSLHQLQRMHIEHIQRRANTCLSSDYTGTKSISCAAAGFTAAPSTRANIIQLGPRVRAQRRDLRFTHSVSGQQSCCCILTRFERMCTRRLRTTPIPHPHNITRRNKTIIIFARVVPAERPAGRLRVGMTKLARNYTARTSIDPGPPDKSGARVNGWGHGIVSSLSCHPAPTLFLHTHRSTCWRMAISIYEYAMRNQTEILKLLTTTCIFISNPF